MVACLFIASYTIFQIANISDGNEHIASNLHEEINLFNDFEQGAFLASNPISDETIISDPIIQTYLVENQINFPHNTSDSHSIVYDVILKKHDLSSMLSLNMQQRCDLYFTTLYSLDPNWYLDPFDNKLYSDSQTLVEFSDYMKQNEYLMRTKLHSELGMPVMEITWPVLNEALIADYNTYYRKQMTIQQLLINDFSHLKIFNQCFISGSQLSDMLENKQFTELQKKQQQQVNGKLAVTPFKLTELEERLLVGDNSFQDCTDVESRIFRWFSRESPVYERWTGEKVMNPPKMNRYIKTTTTSKIKGRDKYFKSKLTNNGKACYMLDFKQSMNGKGIVIHVDNANYNYAIKLILVLRSMENQYPIQMLYHGDSLLSDYKQELIQAARERYDTLPESFQNIKHHFPKDYGLKKGSGGKLGISLPEQELWFVDYKRCIRDNCREKFLGSESFLASLFNSFEEFVFMDTSTLPLQNLEYFFNLPGYKDTGAYFYKTKYFGTINRVVKDTTIFEKLSTTILDNFFFNFDLKNSTERDMGQDFFNGKTFDYMDSGLFVMDRNIHFNSILSAIHMTLFTPITVRLDRNKNDIWWLAFLISGESFTFNKNYAAGVGLETPNSQTYGRELCSGQIGHLNEELTSLDWLSGGLSHCSDYSSIKLDKELRGAKTRFPKLKTEEQLKNYYLTPVEIKHAIIPPLERTGNAGYGWFRDYSICNTKYWCAYLSITLFTFELQDSYIDGTFVEFSEVDTSTWKYYADIWAGAE